jgi:hypothetical protein
MVNFLIVIAEPLRIFILTILAVLITDTGNSLLLVCKQNSLAESQRCGLMTMPEKLTLPV